MLRDVLVVKKQTEHLKSGNNKSQRAKYAATLLSVGWNCKACYTQGDSP